MKITSTIRNFFSASVSLPGTEGSGRLEFIDGLRGVTMLMVVYWHVLVMSLDITTYTAMTLQLFRMPLFFFVSGFFAYSYNYDKNKLRLRLNNRWQRQLLPTLIIFALYILFEVIFYGYWTNGKEFTGDFFNSFTRNGLSEFKSGYWFTFVLVEVFCVFAPLNYLLSRKNISRTRQGLIFLGIAGGCAVLEWFFTKHINVSSGRTAKAIFEFFSLTHLLKYQVFFYLGAAVKAFDTAFWRMLSRKGIAVLIVAATIVVFKIVPRFRVPLEIFYGAACMGILFSLTLFFYLRKVFSRSIALCNLLKYIGKNTLPIYLFHYFIIKLLHDVNIPQFDNLIKGSVWFEIPVITLISLMIVLTVLGIDRLLKIKPRLHRIIFSV